MQLAAADCKLVRAVSITTERHTTARPHDSTAAQAVNAHAAEDDREKSQGMPRNSRDRQIGVRSIDNDKAPAVPLACAGTQCVEFSNAASKTETNRDNTNLETDNPDRVSKDQAPQGGPSSSYIFSHPGNAEKMEMD